MHFPTKTSELIIGGSEIVQCSRQSLAEHSDQLSNWNKDSQSWEHPAPYHIRNGKPRGYRPYLNGQGEATCKYSEQSRLIENLADHQTTTTTAALKGNQSNLEAATRLTSCLKIRAISSPVPIGIRNTDQIPSEYNDETTLINHHSLLAICDTEGVEGSKRLTSESSKSHSAFTARSALLAQSSPLCASCPAPCGNGDCECENASHVANTPDTSKSEGDTSVTSPTAIQKPTSKTATIRLRDSKVTNRKDLIRQKPSPVDKASLAHAIMQVKHSQQRKCLEKALQMTYQYKNKALSAV